MTIRPRTTAIVLTAALAVYFWLLGEEAVWLILIGGPVGLGMGLAEFALPVVGAWIAVANIRFGFRAERLGRRLAQESDSGLDVGQSADDLPRLPSGRLDMNAADAWFDARRADVAAMPTDWRYWYRLAHAYDLAGDRRRGRAAMRYALEISAHDDRPR